MNPGHRHPGIAVLDDPDYGGEIPRNYQKWFLLDELPSAFKG